MPDRPVCGRPMELPGSLENWVPGKPEKHGGPSPTAERDPQPCIAAVRVRVPCGALRHRYFFFPEFPGVGATVPMADEPTANNVTGLLPVPFVPLLFASVSPIALSAPVVGPGMVAGAAATP